MSKESEGHQLSLNYLLRQKHQEANPEKSEEQQVARERMFDLMGELGSPLRWLFTCMEIAEEEIAVAEKTHPHKADEIWSSFTYLQPSALLHIQNPKLYRAHTKEMIERVAKGKTKKKELEAATAAELCCLFCEATQASPLIPDANAAYQKLFKQVFPDVDFMDDLNIQESYPGRADEIIRELRLKYQQPRTTQEKKG